jgi:hypothetical protein
MRMKSHFAKYKFKFLLLLPLMLLVSCWQHKPAEVSSPDNDSTSIITLCRSYNSETYRATGVANAFPLYGRNDVRAIIDIKNLITDNFDHAQIFDIEWLDIENKLLFRKHVELLPGDSVRWLESSIGISPQTRSPGIYQINLYHFREMVASRHFDLLPMDSIIQQWAGRLQAEIILYRKVDRTTGELIDVGDEFEIREKGNVRALILKKEKSILKDHELRLRVDWLGSDSNSCYRKDIILYPGDSLTDISSSIGIPSDKRTPGNYRLQLWLYDTIVAEKEFGLIEKKPKAVSQKKKEVVSKKKEASKKKQAKRRRK